MTIMHDFFRQCPCCKQETRWSFLETYDGIEGECEECECRETFDSWDDVMEVVEE